MINGWLASVAAVQPSRRGGFPTTSLINYFDLSKIIGVSASRLNIHHRLNVNNMGASRWSQLINIIYESIEILFPQFN